MKNLKHNVRLVDGPAIHHELVCQRCGALALDWVSDSVAMTQGHQQDAAQKLCGCDWAGPLAARPDPARAPLGAHYQATDGDKPAFLRGEKAGVPDWLPAVLHGGVWKTVEEAAAFDMQREAQVRDAANREAAQRYQIELENQRKDHQAQLEALRKENQDSVGALVKAIDELNARVPKQ